MTRESILTAAVLALGLPLAAAAQSEMLDADGDGMVTMSEFQTAFPDVEAGTFSSLDTSGDGTLDADELDTARENGVLPATQG